MIRAIIMRQREGKPGGGKGPMLSDKSFTIATANDQTVFILDGKRVGDVRCYQDTVMPTVIQRWGTGGGNIPLIYPIDDGREIEKHQNGLGIGNENDPAYTLDRQQAPAVVIAPTLSASNNPSRSPQSSEITAQIDAMVRATSIVRRLTPMECERLQGFPDGWTEGQADTHRYKQMGNAVAVPVVQWIINRIKKDD